MRKIQKDTIVFYHGDCSDGFGGAWAAWRKLGKKAEYVPLVDRTKIPDDIDGKNIYFIDFVFTGELMKEITNRVKKLVVLDHHLSAEQVVKSAPEWRFEIKKSGATIAWEYFHPKKKTPKLLSCVQDGDLWQVKTSATKFILAYVQSLDFDFAQWSKLAKQLDNKVQLKKVLELGKALQGYDERIYNKLADQNSYLINFEGYEVFAVNSPVFHSAIGNILCRRKSPFAIVWRQEEAGQIYVSLRGDGSVDCSKLAEVYGGGGHKNAAGFTYPSNKPYPWKILDK